MPNRWTFTIKPIKELLDRYVENGVGWIDPFAGKNSPAEITNDLVEKATQNMDALDFLKLQNSNLYQGAIYDPPYSITQARKYGSKKYASMLYWKQCKDELSRIIKLNGLVICCGWNSNGLGKNRGFELKEILLVSHGGSKNDTIVTVEERVC
jgi:hypothetical protein